MPDKMSMSIAVIGCGNVNRRRLHFVRIFAIMIAKKHNCRESDMKLYEKIQYCRKNAGMSQEMFAEKLSVSRQSVSKWETGTAAPDLDNLVAIARLFGVTTDWLLMEDAPEVSAEQSASPEKTEKKPEFLTYDQWFEAAPAVLGGVILSGLGLLIRSLIDWIFRTIFGSLELLTGAANVVYVILSSIFFLAAGLGILLITVGICLMIGYFIYNRSRH